MSSISFTNNYNELKLEDLGIPVLHIIQIETDIDVHYIELSKDIDKLNFE